ncbi:MAG: GAF and ANTAR domain-containing protein, partial [Nakamurella sp.]
EGPSVSAVHEAHLVRIDDLAAERRWPLFTAEASLAGLGAVLAVRITVRNRAWGALTLYSTRSRAFRAEDETIGLLLATCAAVVVARVQTEQQLQAAIVSRDLIGQAKGVLMERFAIDERRAFALLVRLSQDNNRRLIDIADRVVRTREDPAEAVTQLPRRD